MTRRALKVTAAVFGVLLSWAVCLYALYFIFVVGPLTNID
jgi:hypothetical protein